MFFLNQSNGQITSRDLVITAGVTLAAAVVMIALFLVLGRQSSQESQNQDADALIESIKQQAAQDAGQGEEEVTEEDAGVTEATISGTLTSISGKTLTILDDQTKTPVNVLLTNNTVAVYNRSAFDQSDFYAGDLLLVRAEKNRNVLEAVSITVRFSAAPGSAAPVPQKLQERPDGTLQPLGNE